MYAQVVQGGAAPEKRDEMNAVVREHLIPALKQEAGFVGAVNLENRDTGHGMMITFWDTEAQAAGMPTSAAFLQALGRIATVSSGQREPIGVWRVNVLEVDRAPKEVR
ncbi:MAG: hypothetical protein E6I39_00955 [Chloroflexi bacterium]|nr:MAG: hypothetical protein E6J18_14245 [Chloroflexota bacterium]TMF02411.1 MAG: hypothetical protein E6I39_00955 [Chloroflexota bacterium]